MRPVGKMVRVCVCVEVTEVCRITINNPPSFLVCKGRKEGGRKGEGERRKGDEGVEAGSTKGNH